MKDASCFSSYKWPYKVHNFDKENSYYTGNQWSPWSGVDDISEFVIQNTEKCPFSVSKGFCIKRVNFRENVSAFRRDKRNCPLKRMS